MAVLTRIIVIVRSLLHLLVLKERIVGEVGIIHLNFLSRIMIIIVDKVCGVLLIARCAFIHGSIGNCHLLISVKVCWWDDDLVLFFIVWQMVIFSLALLLHQQVVWERGSSIFGSTHWCMQLFLQTEAAINPRIIPIPRMQWCDPEGWVVNVCRFWKLPRASWLFLSSVACPAVALIRWQR